MRSTEERLNGHGGQNGQSGQYSHGGRYGEGEGARYAAQDRGYDERFGGQRPGHYHGQEYHDQGHDLSYSHASYPEDRHGRDMTYDGNHPAQSDPRQNHDEDMKPDHRSNQHQHQEHDQRREVERGYGPPGPAGRAALDHQFEPELRLKQEREAEPRSSYDPYRQQEAKYSGEAASQEPGPFGEEQPMKREPVEEARQEVQEVVVKQVVKVEPGLPAAPTLPVKRGPGRPRNGTRPEGETAVKKEKVVEKVDSTMEIMNNLETIFKGAFLQDSEEEDAVEDENFITVQVGTKHNCRCQIIPYHTIPYHTLLYHRSGEDEEQPQDVDLLPAGGAPPAHHQVRDGPQGEASFTKKMADCHGFSGIMEIWKPIMQSYFSFII